MLWSSDTRAGEGEKEEVGSGWKHVLSSLELARVDIGHPVQDGAPTPTLSCVSKY